MDTAAVRRTDSDNEELLYLRFALRHVNERLCALRPGHNTNLNTYNDLIDERFDLTRRITNATIDRQGSSPYVEVNNPIPVSFVVTMRLGGFYRTRFGSDN